MEVGKREVPASLGRRYTDKIMAQLSVNCFQEFSSSRERLTSILGHPTHWADALDPAPSKDCTLNTAWAEAATSAERLSLAPPFLPAWCVSPTTLPFV
jgi:hypothetical protein